MNIFSKTLIGYIKRQCETVFSSDFENKEIRIFVDSLPAKHTYNVLKEVSDYLSQADNVEYHLKIAKGLWSDWNSKSRKETHLLETLENNNWVDLEDRLTFYRNKKCPEGKDALVVVLIGLEHATDRGGLSDFHVVNEEKLWNQVLHGSYESWVNDLVSYCGLLKGERPAETLEKVLQSIYQYRHRSLIELSDIISTHIIPDSACVHSSNDLLKLVFEKLPAWGIPPFFNIPASDIKLTSLLSEATKFITHQMFNSKSDRNKAIIKIHKANDQSQIDLPQTINNEHIYLNIDEYIRTLVGFIKNGDRVTETELLKTDISQVLEIINKKEYGAKKKAKVLRVTGPSITSIIEAVWTSVKDFKKSCRNNWAPTLITKIDINITCFKHNLSNDYDIDDSAKALLIGCLGGLDETLFDQIELKSDSDSTQRDKFVPVTFSFGKDDNDVKYQSTRSKPGVEFEINIESIYENYNQVNYFIWTLTDNSEERVRLQCAGIILQELNKYSHQLIPTFKINRTFTELFFAGDDEEANRLIREGLVDLRVIDILSGADIKDFDGTIIEIASELSIAYKSYLNIFVNEGYYAANRVKLLKVIECYSKLTNHLLSGDLVGQSEYLNRFYKAFLAIDKSANLGDSFLRSAAALGVSPAVAELSFAREAYLLKYFPEIVSDLLENKIENAEVSFERLMGLVEIRRPLASIIKDKDHRLSTKISSYGLIHCFGDAPSTELSLASQSIMREQDNEDDENIKDLIRQNEESKIVQKVLIDYQKLHPHSNDQLRILVVNVDDLQTVLSGIHHFLIDFLRNQDEFLPPLQVYLKIYTSATSPVLIANQLSAWRDFWSQEVSSDRKCQIRVGHRYAPQSKNVLSFLEKEDDSFDVAFFLKFMTSQQGGDEVEPVAPFTFNFAPSNIDKFPIAEYPRPVDKHDKSRRQTLLSNRRLRIQTCHVEMSARLKHPHNDKNQHYLVFGQVDLTDWEKVISALHKKTQWLACIDPYIDKMLLEGIGNEDVGQRKIVGFNSGLGLYGELNLTVSTMADTITKLNSLMEKRLAILFNDWKPLVCESVSKKIVSEAHEITGLSLIKAIGNSEHIRDVVAYAATKKACLPSPDALMTQLVPIDSVQHWFVGSEESLRPDLLRFEIFLEGQILKVKATVIECKLGIASNQHISKAAKQAEAGLSRLTQIFKPNCNDESSSFDRRFWWAQLQRAIATRALVNFNQDITFKMNAALEHLVEGYFDIEWQAAVITLWSDQKDLSNVPTKLNLPLKGFAEGGLIEEGFDIYHFEYGSDDVVSLLLDSDNNKNKIEIPGGSLRYRCNMSSQYPSVPTRHVEPQHVEPQHVEPQHVEPQHVEPQHVELSSIPDRLLLGVDRNDQPVYWEYGHKELKNRHILIFGASGSGKTYAIQCLLAELAKLGQNSLIVDYTDGFLPNQFEAVFGQIAQPKTHLVLREPLPVDPFSKQSKIIDGFDPIYETDFNVATRVANVFTSVFDTIGEQQFAALIRSIESGLSFDSKFGLDSLIDCLEEEGDIGAALASKITPLIKMKPFGTKADGGWKNMLDDLEQRVHVLQLSGVPRDFQRIISEFVLWDIYDFATSSGNKDKPLPIVLDEIQNLDHRSDSPLEKLLREGRKFGISLILATQTLSNFDAGARDRLFQASHKLFFAPADTEVKRYADILKDNVPGSTRDEWVQRLKSLPKGECLSLGGVVAADGQLKDRVTPVKITSLEKRI